MRRAPIGPLRSSSVRSIRATRPWVSLAPAAAASKRSASCRSSSAQGGTGPGGSSGEGSGGTAAKRYYSRGKEAGTDDGQSHLPRHLLASLLLEAGGQFQAVNRKVILGLV